MPSLFITHADLIHRRPVWEALSDLFLDTDTRSFRAWRVNVLAASPYSLLELENILCNEVYPVCKYNLWSVAGLWSAFDTIKLEEAILQRQAARFSWLHRFHFGRSFMARDAEWQATKIALIKQRHQSLHQIIDENGLTQN